MLTYLPPVARVLLLLSTALLFACTDVPGVTPLRGRGSGGQTLRIVGAGFLEHGAPVVYVGQRSSKAVIVESDRLITVVTPECDVAGVVDVEIHFADGKVMTYASSFTYEDRGVVLRPEG